MTTSTERQHYRDLVAQVAAKARAILPAQVNGRIESAVKLVLANDVEPLEDGSIRVGSASDPQKTYILIGHACTCTDFTQQKAPEGWCKHRIAAGIAKRTKEILATEAPPALAPQPLPEAPASVNVHLSIAGRQVQLTLRDSDEVRLLARLEEVLQRFPQPTPPAQPASQGEGWCQKHGVALKLNHGKDGRTWLSHRTAEGQWCKGR